MAQSQAHLRLLVRWTFGQDTGRRGRSSGAVRFASTRIVYQAASSCPVARNHAVQLGAHLASVDAPLRFRLEQAPSIGRFMFGFRNRIPRSRLSGLSLRDNPSASPITRSQLSATQDQEYFSRSCPLRLCHDGGARKSLTCGSKSRADQRSLWPDL